MTPIQPLSHLILILLLTASPVIFSETQPRPAYLDQPSRILAAGVTSEPDRPLPLLIFLPYTTSSASDFYENVKDYQPFKEYVAIIPEGVTEREHYLPDFMAFVRWYEERILKDIERARRQYPVDSTKIYLQGFSLGGDLGWALMIRQKEIFKGALIIGSRCSYPADSRQLLWLKNNQRRFFFLIGSEDSRDRKKGMIASYKITGKTGLLSRYEEFDGGHSYPKDELYLQALEWLFKP